MSEVIPVRKLKNFLVYKMVGLPYHYVMPRKEYFEYIGRYGSDYVGARITIVTHFDGVEDLKKETTDALAILKEVWERHTSARPEHNWMAWEKLSEDGSIDMQIEAMEQYADQRERSRQGGLTVKEYEALVDDKRKLLRRIEQVVLGDDSESDLKFDLLAQPVQHLKNVYDLTRKENLLMPQACKTKIKCECLCHKGGDLVVKHTVLYCNDGWIEITDRAVISKKTLESPWETLLRDEMTNNLWIDKKQADQVIAFINKLISPP